MHVLMAVWAAGGTVPVEVGVARRLVEAGHDVTVLAEPSMQPAIAAAGASFRSWQRPPHPVEEAIADWECRTPITLFRRLLDRLITGPSALYAADVRDVCGERAVDAAVVDFSLMGALAGTQSLGIPTAASFPNVYVRPRPGEPTFGLGLFPAANAVTRTRDRLLPRVLERVWDLGLKDLNATRRDLALPALPHVWSQVDSAERVLLLTAESFDFPAPPRPAAVRYVGPVLDDPSWAAGDVDLPPGDEPLVLVGVSTGRTRGQPELLQRVVTALANAPVRAVVATGPAAGPLSAPRPGIRIVPAAPHSRLLPHASAMITHGGHGTVIKALAAGVPTLVLPLGRDQPDNAARVVWHSAGLRLRHTASADRIRSAVLSLLRDPGYAASAAALGEAIRAETDDRRIVTAVEGLQAA